MKRTGYIPDQADLDYIERASAPIHPVLEAIEAAAGPAAVPILDRESGRVLAVLAAGRRRILEIGTGLGYSTLWMALAQPPAGRIVTIDVEPGRLERARGWWREAGVGDDRIVSINRAALDALADEDAHELAGPFDLVFIDAVKTEYPAYIEAAIPRLARGALVVADNALRHGDLGRHPTGEGDEVAEATRAANAALLCDRRFTGALLPVGDGLLVGALRL